MTLTATREYELRDQRASGLTGSITNYNTMASMLPQVTPVYYFYQNERPAGYSEERYGVWPEGASLVLKCQFASTHKSPGTRRNMSTVTMVIAANELPDNPLLLTGPLNRIFSYSCTCGSGAGTNRACAHVCAFVRGLMSPDTVRSAKRNVGLRTDIHAPAEHQPTQTGPPSVGRDRNILFNPAPAPQPRTAARRAHSRWRQPTPGDQRRPPIFTGQTQTHHTPGHAQQPQGQPEGAQPQGQYQGAQPQGAQSQGRSQGAQLQGEPQGTQPQGQPQGAQPQGAQPHGQPQGTQQHGHPQGTQQHGHPHQPHGQGHQAQPQPHNQSHHGRQQPNSAQMPQILPLQNRANTCYACSVTQGLYVLDIVPHLLPGNTPFEDNLTNLMRQILTVNPSTSPPFDLVPAVNALNFCLPPQNMFQIGQQECAGEYLDSLLASLNVGPYISSFEESGTCLICNTPQYSAFNTRSQFLMLLEIDQNSLNAVDLFTEINTVLQTPFFSLTCQNAQCSAFQTRIGTRVQCSEQRLSIYWVGQKCLRQVSKPPANTSLWSGKQCVVVIPYTGRSARTGHWFTFLKVGGIWWRSDTSLPRPVRQNPFTDQLLATNQVSASEFTVDLVFMK